MKVEVRGPAATTATISLVIDERVRVEVAPSFDPEHLRAVLEVLGQC